MAEAARRIAYVTGGMGGLGTAICKRLCRAGQVVIAGCRPGSPRRERWLEQMADEGLSVTASEADVSDWDSTHRALEALSKEVGPVDILINNAGTTRDCLFKQMSPADWRTVVD
ncbi:MAG TPA: SDR family NAD(P)-dependent oxidoreductase, partial [Steroidobacteraceae bacterium]